ncbi:MAG: gliding motility protein GldM, partial [Chitinophagaceae bacterium]|nr:gliding motility protein GldM [Chitinophagaceae bacterium]
MSLPKEPRQLMINLMYLVLTALLAMNVSSEILNAFKIVDESINSSSKNIENNNQVTIANFKLALEDPKIIA